MGAWGCPVKVDNFDGTALNTGAGPSGWFEYHSPDVRYPRSKNNVRVQNGELQLLGTFDRATQTVMGSAIGDRYNQLYGRWEVRARSDRGNGYSAVSLLWPAGKGVWPNDGEIDLFEIPKGDRARMWSVVHNLPSNSQKGKWTDVDATRWHTYAVEWTPTKVTFLLDNVRVFEMATQYLVPSTSPMRLALQFDAQRIQDGCNGWYQCPDATTPPETVMHVDYIKIWKMPQG
jgi:hypothetical protein